MKNEELGRGLRPNTKMHESPLARDTKMGGRVKWSLAGHERVNGEISEECQRKIMMRTKSVYSA